MSKNRLRGLFSRDRVSDAGRRERWSAVSSRALSYGVTVLSVAATTLLRFELQSLLGDYARFLPSVLAVMFSAWFGGLGPGLLATGLSAFSAGYLPLSPAEHPLSMAQPRDVVQLTMFCAIGVMISALSGALRSEVAERRHAEQASKAQAGALRDVIERLTQESDLERLQGLVLTAIVHQLEGTGGELWSLDQETGTARMVLDYRDGQVSAGESSPLECSPIESPLVPGWGDLQASVFRGESLFIGDLRSDSRLPDCVRTGLLQMGMRSLLIVPIREQGRLVGLYTVRNSDPKRYHPSEIQLARALAHHVTLAMELTRLAEQAQHAAIAQEREQAAAVRLAELSAANRALLSTLDALAAEPELGEFLGTVVAAITGQLHAVSSSLWLFDDDTQAASLHLAYHDGRILLPAESGYPQTTFSLAGLSEDPSWVAILRERRPVVHAIPTSASVPAAVREYLAAQGVRTSIVFPLALGDRAIGIFTVRFNTEKAIAPEKLGMAHALAHQATMAIQMARLAEQVRRTAVVEERNRMAREIHDTLAQAFAGVLLQLEATRCVLARDPERGDAHIETARQLAREGLSEARRSVHALRPQALEEGDLAPALARMTGQLESDPATRLQFRLTGGPRSLPPDVATHLLRIGQEAVTNALRHARASEVLVELAFAEHEVRLAVRDDGQGFAADAHHREGSFGLTSMRERAAAIGAQLALASDPGAGTGVLVTWPFPRA